MELPHLRQTIETLAHAILLALSCLLSYWLITSILGRAHFISTHDDLLGGMWAVIATIFVYHDSYAQSASSALMRMAATSISFVLCFVYLLIFPFHALGMTALICIGAVAVALVGRPEAGITTGITTTVIMVVAGLSPDKPWLQPILRLLDTIVGVAVGVAAAQIGSHISRHALRDREHKELAVQERMQM
jgi:uncharacterized membrane protein YccC